MYVVPTGVVERDELARVFAWPNCCTQEEHDSAPDFMPGPVVEVGGVGSFPQATSKVPGAGTVRVEGNTCLCVQEKPMLADVVRTR